MSLSEDEIDLVRSSFRHLAQLQPAAAAMFYDRLFEIAPEVRPLFPGDMEVQGTKLMSMLGAIVAQIHDHAVLVPMVSDLARRHVAYGARMPHYGKVGEALLWTLDQRLGEAFTPELRAAWAKAYAALTAVMIAAAAEALPGG
jgi:hemoglobin-like flavoprotein